MPEHPVPGLTAAPYRDLTPDTVLDAVEAAGFPTDGRVLALNSYENRVYQVGIDAADPVIVKFYRPARWTDAAILEEHAFSLELAAAEIPVVAPLVRGGRTLLGIAGFRYAVFPRRGGRWPDLERAEERVRMGRFLGRMHRVGAAARFEHRRTLAIDWMAIDSAEQILDGDWLPGYLRTRYADTVDALVAAAGARWSAAAPVRTFRIHGDCHRSNVLWTDTGPHFVDLDDCLSGPAVQDVWMLLAGSPAEQTAQLRDLLEGYEQFAPFERAELLLIEPLRALRMIHYAAWLARRWEDPAFPQAFPWFGTPRYWEDHVRELAEQLEALDAAPLRP